MWSVALHSEFAVTAFNTWRESILHMEWTGMALHLFSCIFLCLVKKICCYFILSCLDLIDLREQACSPAVAAICFGDASHCA